MANNPQPNHITDELWWFINQLEALEPSDTEFAGAWGRFKPGYHCDYWELWNHKVNGVFVWRNDYSIKLPDDKVGGTPLEQFGAATDWTFQSTQAGNSANIRKYGGRVAVAFANRDPRLKGWREVLIQADGDKPPEGFDFVTWTTRTPDSTHEWHGHFSCLRKYLRDLRVFQAMISILKGETLAQWLAGSGDDMATVFTWQGNVWISRGDAMVRELVGKLPPGAATTPELNVVTDAHRCYPGKDNRAPNVGYPTPDLKDRGWTEDLVTLAFGPPKKTADVTVELSPEDVAALTKGAHDGAMAGAAEAIAGAKIVGVIEPAA